MIATKQNQELESSTDFLNKIDNVRFIAKESLDPTMRRKLGQFLTPYAIAEFMATMFQSNKDDVHLLDAGAGTGILSAAFIRRQLARKFLPRTIQG